ncbi:MAG: alpha/beta fold hydrolase [Gemmatimonadales bacterium]
MTSPEQPTTELIRVNGNDLFTRAVGQGPNVVVLHGGPGAHHDYLLPQFDGLAGGRRMLYYDQRGGGKSSIRRKAPVGWQDHVCDLDALIDHWTLSPVTLLGYSWGGLLAILYGITHPDKVGRLALVSPAPITAAGRQEFERRFRSRAAGPRIKTLRKQLALSGLRERDVTAYRQRAFELSVAPYFANPDRARELTPFRVNGRIQEAVWRTLGEYDLRDAVGRLVVPALVIHGRQDVIPLSSSELTASLLQARLEICEDSGHVPYIEAYDQFIRALDRFLPQSNSATRAKPC